jgi:hypothetical protein
MKKITMPKMNKKVVSSILSVVVLLTIFVTSFMGSYYLNKYLSKDYTIEATVTEVIVDTSEVFFETNSGHIFYIVTDEIFAVNEQYTLTFSTNGTPTVEDDEIYHISRNIEMSMY